MECDGRTDRKNSSGYYSGLNCEQCGCAVKTDHIAVTVKSPCSSCASRGNFIGYQCKSTLNLSWPYWFKSCWMARLHSNLRVTVSLPLQWAADAFSHPMSLHVRFKELAQVWAIDHSPLMDRVSGTIYLSIYVIPHLLSWEFHQELQTLVF